MLQIAKEVFENQTPLFYIQSIQHLLTINNL